jgi:hypothetical protein
MNPRAQAGLEYLMTYGWALVLISVVAAILVFVVGSPAGETTFSSSDPAKMALKAGAAAGTDAEIKLQNLTGGRLDVTDSTLTGAFSGATCTLNGLALPTGSSSIEVMGGGEIDLVCSGVSGSSGTISLQYTDYAGLQRQIDISMGGAVTADPNFVAYYTFNKGSGTTAADSAGSNDGTLTNFACTTLDCDPNSGWVSTGMSGNAISFDGSNDFVDVGPNIGNFGIGDWTISTWVKVSNGNAFDVIVGKGNIAAGDFILYKHINDNTLYLYADAGQILISVIDPSLMNIWVHFVGVKVGSNAYIYVNGIRRSTDSSAGSANISNPHNLTIGASEDGSLSHADALIDEVRIYNRALSETEICSLCNSLASCSC